MTSLSKPQLLAGVRDLPPLPAALADLIATLDDEDAGCDDLARCIARDQALAARTLRLANSPFYGMPRRVNSIADATAVLGLRTLRSVALAAGLANSFRPPQCAGFDFAAFWRHAVGTALAAAALARVLRMDEGLAFTAGLLHDIGRLALASAFSTDYAAALAHRAEIDVPIHEAERARLDCDHAEVGALIAEHWRFPIGVVAAIGGHHAPPAPALGAPAAASLADLVHVADNLAHALGLSGLDDDLVPPLSMPAWLRLGLDDARCLEAMGETRARHEALCAAILA